MSTKFQDDDDVSTIDSEQELNLEPPSMYKVVFVNDDFTPMDFVVEVLQSIFRLDEAAANRVTLEVHKSGKGVAGVYTFEIAETKQAMAMNMAQKNEHPLLTVLEKV